MSDSREGRVNSIGMTERELSRLISGIEASERASSAGKRRVHARWPFLAETVPLELEQPGGGKADLRVACRNISRGGASLLHRSFLYPGTRCWLRLPHPTAGYRELEGVIAHCQHIVGVVHDIGVKFDSEINIKEYLEKDPMASYYSLEKVKPEEIEGRLLLADAGELDREIVRHFMRDTRVRIAECGTGDEALTQAQTGVQAVLADFQLPDMSGAELIEKLHEQGMHVPVVLMSSDRSAMARQALRAARSDGFLAKPLTQDLLLRVLGEFLLNDAVETPPAQTGDVPKELADRFVSQMLKSAAELQACIANEDPMACYATCMRIAGTAPCVGRHELARTAEAAGEAVARSMSPAEAHAELDALLQACARMAA